MTDVHTFTPRRSEARTESFVAAGVAAALVAGYLYVGQGQRDVRLLAGLAALAAGVVLLGYLLRAHVQWVDEIRLSAESATLMRNDAPQTLPWTAVRFVRHYSRGGEHWILTAHPGHATMIIRADGLSREEAARLRELIPALHAAATDADGPAR